MKPPRYSIYSANGAFQLTPLCPDTNDICKCEKCINALNIKRCKTCNSIKVLCNFIPDKEKF